MMKQSEEQGFCGHIPPNQGKNIASGAHISVENSGFSINRVTNHVSCFKIIQVRIFTHSLLYFSNNIINKDL